MSQRVPVRCLLQAKPRALLPTLSMLTSAFLWGISWYPMRLLERAGIGGLWLLLVLHLSPLVVTLPFASRGLGALARQPGWVLMLALGTAWSEIGFILAVLQGEVLRLMLLFYLSPLWATLLGVWLLRERLSRVVVFSLGLSMTGAFFTLWDEKVGMPLPSSVADFLALSAGFGYALAMTAGRKLQDLPIPTKLAGIWLVGVLVSGTAIGLMRIPVPSVPIHVIVLAGGLGIFGILLMTVLIQYATTHLPVHRSSVLSLFELAVAAIAAGVLTDETVSRWEWGGAGLITLGAYLSTRARVAATA